LDHMRTIKHAETIRAATDPRRLEILGLLMDEAHTLSSLGAVLDRHPAWVRHHVKALERVGLVRLVETRATKNYTEKFYRATAAAYTLSMLVRPATSAPANVIAMVSHDLALELLAAESEAGTLVAPVVTGSLDGLIGVRQGLADVAGCHLLDADTGEYNIPYARHLFPDTDTVIVTLAHREQGLIVAPGNPHKLGSISDIGDRDVVLVNRNPGSGTRLWLDRMLKAEGMAAGSVRGYASWVDTHTDAAALVASGKADVAVGISAAAERYQLDFVPLFRERYDLVMKREFYETEEAARLLDLLHARAFRRSVERIRGYDAGAMGDEYRLAV